MEYARKEILEGPKILSETEIQERLYGQYLGGRKKIGKTAANWTGIEILQGELSTLRSELIALRREKDRLFSELELKKRGSRRPVSRLSIVGALLLVGLIGYPFRTQFLQAASPGGMEQTPYTVQVGVYDVRRSAQLAVEHLSGLGYPAFLVEFPNRSGSARYKIYVGRFVTKQEAELEKLKLTADPRFSDAFVRLQ